MEAGASRREAEKSGAGAVGAVQTTRVSDEFLRRLVHDMRASLNTITGWAELVRSGQLDASHYGRAGEIITRHARQLTDRMNDAIDTWRLTSGLMRLTRSRFVVDDLVLKALAAIRPQLEQRGVECRVLRNAPDGQITGDPARLARALAALTAHAAQQTSRGGVVDVSIEASDPERIIILVAGESGAEQGEALLRRVEDGAPVRAGSASEIGLPLAADLIALHGGTVNVGSPGDDSDAILFTISLPRAGSSAVLDETPACASAFPPHLLQNVRVLLVDDEPDAREALARTLSHHGAAVTQAGSVSEAWQMLHEAPVDVLFADIAMPEHDGYELISAVRKDRELANLPAAAITAYASPEDRRRVLAAGFQQHIGKPVEVEVLLATASTLSQFSPHRR